MISSYSDIKELISVAEKGSKKSQALKYRSQPVDVKIEKARRERIKNNNLESDQRMKKGSLIALFVFLGLESVAIFVIIFIQGFSKSFHLEEWSFRILIGGTIFEVVEILKIAIRHLFPSKDN